MVTVQVRSIAMLQRRLRPCQMEWRSYAACRGKDLSCGTTRATGCTYKSSGMLPSGDQSVAAIAIDESLQVMVRKGTPPRREVNSAPFGTQRCQITNRKGCLLDP